MDTGITPVMPVGNGMGDGFGMGCGGGAWIFGLIVLLALFNGGFNGNGNGNSNAIQNDINRGFDSQNLQAQTRDIMGAVTSGTAQTIAASTANASNAINAIKDGNAAIIREFGTVETALTALMGKQQECCCETLRAIDATNYANAMNTQKILDAITGNRIADLTAKVQSLELAQAVAGVVRYPMISTYSSGTNPFCPGTTTSTGTGA